MIWYNTQVDLNEANNKLYYMLHRQCSLPMSTKIKGSKSFKAAQETLDGIGIMAHTRAIMCGV